MSPARNELTWEMLQIRVIVLQIELFDNRSQIDQSLILVRYPVTRVYRVDFCRELAGIGRIYQREVDLLDVAKQVDNVFQARQKTRLGQVDSDA